MNRSRALRRFRAWERYAYVTGMGSLPGRDFPGQTRTTPGRYRAWGAYRGKCWYLVLNPR